MAGKATKTPEGYTVVGPDVPDNLTITLPGSKVRILRSELPLTDKLNPNHVTCGAKLPNTDGKKTCRNLAGERTPHLGTGKCWRHGGLSPGRPIIHGKRSSKLRVSLMEEITRVMNDPELLTLNQPIAMMKVALNRQLELAAAKDEEFALALETMEESGIDITDPQFDLSKLAPFTNVDTELIKTLVMSVRNAYEMQFSRRFSISIRELGAIIAQIGYAFNRIADKYGMSSEAKMEFGQAMRALKTSGPIDTQLAVAGGMNTARQIEVSSDNNSDNSSEEDD